MCTQGLLDKQQITPCPAGMGEHVSKGKKMGLEINGLNAGQTTRQTQAKGGQRVGGDESERANKPSSGASGSTTTVSISDEAKSLSQLQGEVSKAAPFNESKVAELKAAIADGSYKPDASRIAGKLLDIDGSF